MQLKILNSNSDGNCYFMESDTGEILILDFGLSFTTIKQALNFDYSKVVGVLITHSHGDHYKGVKDGLKAGLKFFMSKETAEEIGVAHQGAKHHNVNIVWNKKTFELESFKIVPFELKHDVKCFGYLINHPESGNTVFITDTFYIPYKFPNLTNIIVEANYCQKIVDANLSKENKFIRDRVLQSHMEIQTTKQFLLANDLSNCNKIVLIHLSDRNSNAEQFQQIISDATQTPVFIAVPNLIVNLNKDPF